MSQFSLTRSTKARRDLEARLRRNKLLHGRSAFVDRPDDGVRGRRLVPRLFPEGRQANATYASRMMHEARPTRNSRPSGDSDDRDNGRAQKRSDSTMNYGD
jgi:hypothetical protein